MSYIISEEMKFPTSTSKKRKKWVTFICTHCNKRSSKWYQKNTWNCKCCHCSKGGFNTLEFIKKAQSIHAELYDYSGTVYVNKRTKVSIKCAKHGEFFQNPSEHLEGHGCLKCGTEVRALQQQLPANVWQDRLNIYPQITFKDLSQITGYHAKLDLICKVHGSFETTLGQIGKAKYLCFECARNAHQEQSARPNLLNETATLYYVYIPSIDMYKLGVTVQPLNERIGVEYTEILTKEMQYSDALKLEHQLHCELKDFRYQGSKKLLKAGNTELYKIDISLYLERALT